MHKPKEKEKNNHLIKHYLSEYNVLSNNNQLDKGYKYFRYFHMYI